LDKKIILVMIIIAVASSLGTAYSLGGTNIIFRTSDGITDHEVMRITSDGKVGIGTTTPQSTLDVSGNIKASGTITSPTIETLRCNNFNRHADLSYCNLSDRDLQDIDVKYANLSGVNLSDTDLTGANLSGANLDGAYANPPCSGHEICEILPTS
jgi:hypothetical protein